MALQLNLKKAQATLQLCLEKAGIKTPPAVELALVLDVSGSFEDEHRDGTTNDLLTRLVPWGLTFDPDGKLDVITFSNGAEAVHSVGAVNALNYKGFVADRVVGRVPGWGGGTDYSYAIEAALRSFGWLPSPGKKAGFFGRLLGRQDEPASLKPKKRSLVLFVTDGDNVDKERTLQVLQASEARRDEVYFLFIGISNQGSRFPFLERIGDNFGNTGFIAIQNLREFVSNSDEELNGRLLSEELIGWLGEARSRAALVP